MIRRSTALVLPLSVVAILICVNMLMTVAETTKLNAALKTDALVYQPTDDTKMPPKRLIPVPAAPVPAAPVPAAPVPAAPVPAVDQVVKKDPIQGNEEPPESKLAFQALLTPSKVQGIEISPDKVTIASTKRFQIVTVKADGKVKWMVFNKAKEPVEWLQLPGTKSIQIFPNYGLDDEITVYAYTAVAGEPTEPVKAVIVVSKDTSRPLPDEPPTKPVEKPVEKPAVGQNLHLTIITDADLAKTNQILATLVASKDLRAGVENRDHKFWIMDQKKDVNDIKERGFDEYVRSIKRIPLYIIQDASGTVVDSGPLPTTLVSIFQKLDILAPPKFGGPSGSGGTKIN